MALTSGTRLGPYEIQASLGAGGMGEVYRAKDTRLDRTVAVKILASHLSSSPELKQRMEREARAISSLNHPHICHPAKRRLGGDRHPYLQARFWIAARFPGPPPRVADIRGVRPRQPVDRSANAFTSSESVAEGNGKSANETALNSKNRN
jgi:hypothetical protein